MRIGGVKVYDATKPLHITITAADVKNGNTKDPGACAAALAIKRITHSKDARVHIGRTYVKESDRWVRYDTPGSLRAEVIAFDRGGAFAPGKYILRAVRPSHRNLSGRQGTSPRYSHARKNPRRTARPKHVTLGIREKGANR